jgi:hypothetical protein
MATLTPQFFELLEADKKEIWFQAMTMQADKWPRVFEHQTSGKAYEDRLRIGGLGSLATKPEGTPIAFDDPIQGQRVRSVHSTYGLGWRATMEMMQDDLHGIMNRVASELGLATADHRERLAWSLIDDFFTGTTYTGLEGDTFGAVNHANLKAGGTQSNILNPAVALGVTGLEAIMTMAMTTTSDEGRFIDLEHAILVVHPNLMHQARILLNTEREVDTSNWNVSTVETGVSGLSPVSVPYLSSTTGWTVHAPPGRNSITFSERMEPEYTAAGDPDTKDQKHYVCWRGMVYFSEWRNNYGSNF